MYSYPRSEYHYLLFAITTSPSHGFLKHQIVHFYLLSSCFLHKRLTVENPQPNYQRNVNTMGLAIILRRPMFYFNSLMFF
jgi:hypothetical protein